MVKNLPASARDVRDAGLILGLGRPLEESLATQSSVFAMENPMDRGAWRATVHRVAKSRTRLMRDLTHMQAHMQTSKRGFVFYDF